MTSAKFLPRERVTRCPRPLGRGEPFKPHAYAPSQTAGRGKPCPIERLPGAAERARGTDTGFKETLSPARPRLLVYLFCVVCHGLGEKDQCVLIGVGDCAKETFAEFLSPGFAFEVCLSERRSRLQSGPETACTFVFSVSFLG
jgi:hypothetical protein